MTALLAAIAGMPLWNRVAPAFIFTWPAALFVVYQTMLDTIVWAEQQSLRAAARWRSRSTAAAFLLWRTGGK